MNVAPDSGSNSTSSLFSSPLALGAAGLGALGIGSMIAQGPGQLPSQFGQATTNAGWEATTGQANIGVGQGLVNQGQTALGMAQLGELTPEQQAQLKVYSGGLTNQARQQFYSMGTNPDQNTAFLSASEDIAAKTNAMAQQQIQSTIALGLGQISSGASLENIGTGEINVADQTLIAAGEAQIKQDQQYSSNLTAAFSAIGTMFGAIAGGPAGAAIGGAAGKILGSATA
jgi:hypothetical protein